jgi:Phosphoribosylformimino-5-aminoimidazole carboxamide ribonucleotide (ProFAR) isomerase
LKNLVLDKIILGADAQNEMIAVSGWQEATDVSIFQFIGHYKEKGISKVISTDIARDGMLTGPSLELYQQILDQFPSLELIASGGVASMQDIIELDQMGVPGVITGKAIYEGKISLAEIRKFIG